MHLTRTLAPALAAATLALTACGDDASSPATTTSTAAATTTTATTPSTSTGTGGANTAAVVAKAKAFLATLSDEQRTAVQLDYDAGAASTSWSNLPAALAPRSGVALRDMTAAQRKAALALMQTALSEQGYTELEGIRAADDYLAAQQASGGGGGPGGGDDYGAGKYYVAFYGTPTTDGRWLLQYTGHHDTFNIGYDGDEVSFGPEFTGVEPFRFQSGGKTIGPVDDEAAAMRAVIEAMSAAQRKTATLAQAYDDLLLGAQEDGPFPGTPEGVTVADLPQAAQDAVTELIRTYVGDLEETAAEAKVKAYVADYAKTKFAFTGGGDTEQQGFYARLDGPVVWIELSTQNGIVLSGNHYHSIYREQGADYGGGA